MTNFGWFDRLPLWGVFLTTVALILVAIEAGYRLGNLATSTVARGGQVAPERDGRGHARPGRVPARVHVRPGGVSLRCPEGPDPRRSQRDRDRLSAHVVASRAARGRSRESSSGSTYRFDRSMRREDRIAESIARSEALHGQLWSRAVEASQATSSPVLVSLYIQSLNEVIDLHSKRITLGLRNRIPAAIWAALYFVSCVGIGRDGIPCGAGRDGTVAGRGGPGLDVLGGDRPDRRPRPPP